MIIKKPLKDIIYVYYFIMSYVLLVVELSYLSTWSEFQRINIHN